MFWCVGAFPPFKKPTKWNKEVEDLFTYTYGKIQYVKLIYSFIGFHFSGTHFVKACCWHIPLTVGRDKNDNQ